MITTPRLRLRPYIIEDFEPYWAMMSAAAKQALPGSVTLAREDAWNRVLRCIGHWQVFGFGIFALEERETGRFVGEAGIARFERGLGKNFDGFAEATWTINPDARGRGYAREAAEQAHLWYDEQHGPARTVCMIHPANEASLRVAATVGYTEFTRSAYKSETLILLERQK